MHDQGAYNHFVRKNNSNITNMTTFDVEIGQSINKIYKQKLSQRPSSEIPIREFKRDLNLIAKKQSNGNNCISSKKKPLCKVPQSTENEKLMNRSGTVPSLNYADQHESKNNCKCWLLLIL